MDEERDFLMFSDSSSAGSPPEPEILLNDVIVAIQEAENKINVAIQEAKNKINRRIILGVMLMSMVMILCTLVLFFKPPNCAAYAQSVNHTQEDTCKNTTVNIVVNLHVYANATSFYDTPEDECSINDKKVYDMGLYDATLLYKEEMTEKTFALFAGMGLGFTALVLPSPTP